jgi:hypothetical protein
MKEIESIQQFKDQSTWKLAGIGIITYGVYFAYYIKKQTVKINELVGEGDRISVGFVNSILVMSYISLILFFAYLAVDDGHPVEIISTLFDRILGIMVLIWGFKARNRINSTYEITTEDKQWFHGLWTFLFTPLYFNYKINCISEERVEQITAADS